LIPLPGGQPTDTSLQIDINVIQPTPNISPTHSLRSFSAEEREGIDSSNTFAGIPFLIVPPSPVRVRRVSFSDHSQSSSTENLSVTTLPSNPDISISVTVDGEEEEEEVEVEDGKTGSKAATGGSSSTQRRSRCVRQASLQALTL